MRGYRGEMKMDCSGFVFAQVSEQAPSQEYQEFCARQSMKVGGWRPDWRKLHHPG